MCELGKPEYAPEVRMEVKGQKSQNSKGLNWKVRRTTEMN